MANVLIYFKVGLPTPSQAHRCTILTADTLEILQPCTNPSICGIYSKSQYTCVVIYSPSVTLPSCLLIQWIWAAITPRTIEVYQNKWDALVIPMHWVPDDVSLYLASSCVESLCQLIFADADIWYYFVLGIRWCKDIIKSYCRPATTNTLPTNFQPYKHPFGSSPSVTSRPVTTATPNKMDAISQTNLYQYIYSTLTFCSWV